MHFPNKTESFANQHKRFLFVTDPSCLVGHRIRGNITLMSVLAVGGHGVVYHALEDSPDSEVPPRAYAVKVLSKFGLFSRELRFLKREFAMHARVSGHAHVLAFHDVIEERDFFFVLLDYIPSGDLYGLIESRKVFEGNDKLIKTVFVQLLDAVAHCHSRGIAHRDIKPENILCRDGGKHILLADFGLATDKMNVSEHGFGSEPYMAPQCFRRYSKNRPYSTRHADVWALGVVLTNLVCIRSPWSRATNESSMFRAFLDDPYYLLRVLPISLELNTILRETFALDPEARPTLAALRASVLAVSRFSRDEGSPDLLSVTLEPIVRRKVINLTAEDIARLESDARAEERAAACRLDAEGVSESSSESSDDDARHTGEDSLPSLPHIFSTPSLAASETTPRAPQVASFTPIFSIMDSDSDDSDDWSVDSDGPITPETRSVPDVDIGGVPRISLDSSDVEETKSCIPMARRCSVRKSWIL